MNTRNATDQAQLTNHLCETVKLFHLDTVRLVSCHWVISKLTAD